MLHCIHRRTLLLLLGTLSLVALPASPEVRWSLGSPRSRHFAFPVGDTQVLLIGGIQGQMPGLYDGFVRFYSSETIELYDYRSGVVRSSPALPEAVWGAVELKDKRIFACGINNCYLYDPATDARIQTPPVPYCCADSLVTPADGRVLTAGGHWAMWNSLRDSAVFDPQSRAWAATSPLNGERESAALIRLRDGRVLAIAGLRDQVRFVPLSLGSVEVFNPETNTWAKAGDMASYPWVRAGYSEGLGEVTAALLPDGRVLAGNNQGSQIYDPVPGTWSTIDLEIPWESSVTVMPNGEVLIAGGQITFLTGAKQIEEVTDKVTIFDPATGNKATPTPLAVPRANHTAVVTGDGRVLLTGGELTGEGTDLYSYMLVPYSFTDSVESYPWEPRLSVMLDPGYYVATASQPPASLEGFGQPSDGFYGIEVQTNGGPLSGGLNFGGLLSASNKELAFGAFLIGDAEDVLISARFPSPSKYVATMRVLNSQGNVVVGPSTGSAQLTASGNFQPGFYIVEIRGNSTFDTNTVVLSCTIVAPKLVGGGNAGGILIGRRQVPGFIAFYLPVKEQVSIRVNNQTTYGWPRGVGDVVLTLLDGMGKTIQRVGPK
jgi:hypothetical protein